MAIGRVDTPRDSHTARENAAYGRRLSNVEPIDCAAEGSSRRARSASEVSRYAVGADPSTAIAIVSLPKAAVPAIIGLATGARATVMMTAARVCALGRGTPSGGDG